MKFQEGDRVVVSNPCSSYNLGIIGTVKRTAPHNRTLGDLIFIIPEPEDPLSKSVWGYAADGVKCLLFWAYELELEGNVVE